MTEKDTSKQQTAGKASAQAASSTQAYLNISEIKDGVVVLKDGSLRAVMMTSAINFALKSGGEQDALIYAYQRFLNSLSFPVQILVQSRKLDLDYYIEKLSKKAEEQSIELVKLQILEYTEFIKRLINVTNIMDKRFYVIVPFYPVGVEASKGFFSKLFATSATKDAVAKKADEKFEESKVQLMQRVEAIAGSLGAIGLRAVTLNSEELVELFYSIYNPGTATKQRLANVDELTAASIRSHVGGASPDQTPQPTVSAPGSDARPVVPDEDKLVASISSDRSQDELKDTAQPQEQPNG